MTTKHFSGTSETGDFHEALKNAIADAKEGLTTDFVKWKLEYVSGQSGGFVQEDRLTVGISAEPPSG